MIPGAGDGLFAAEAFTKGTVLGEYTGPLVHDKDVDDLQEAESYDQRTTRFRISAGKSESHLSQNLFTSHSSLLTGVDACIDGAGGSSMLAYINCENRSKKRNVAFSYVEGKYRRKIVATASQKIAQGRELLAAYS